MQLRPNRTWWLVPAAAAMLGAALTGPAGAAAEDDPQVPHEQGLANCTGGIQEQSLARLDDTPASIGETGVFVPLVGSGVPVTVPNGDNDQFVIRFTGEAVLTGQPVPVLVPADRVELQLVVISGGVSTPLPPLNDPTFTTGVGESDALQACTRLGPGNYTIGARWRAVDVAGAGNLVATMDDWLLSVEQNN
jgi:hypothetical protein